jgi:putative ABC transport system ATP-binding protein
VRPPTEAEQRALIAADPAFPAGSAASPRPVVSAARVTKAFGSGSQQVVALDGVTLDVEQGEFVCLLGASGCGKSTLLNLMGLLDEPSQGKVALDGKRIERYGDRELARVRNERVGFIFQQFHLVSDLSVVDNVEIPLLYRKMSNKERRKAALAALDRVGLSSRTQHFPTQLSGGQQQRVAIARAIVGKPGILLADEPTGNLDSQMGDEIMGILEDLNQNEGATIVMVTHDPRMADKTHRVVRLFDGRQVQ